MRSTTELETVVTIICANERQMRRSDVLRPFMEIIASELGGRGIVGGGGMVGWKRCGCAHRWAISPLPKLPWPPAPVPPSPPALASPSDPSASSHSCSTEKGSPIKPSDPQRTVDIEGLEAEDLEYNYDQKGLAELRRRMKDAVANYQGGGGGGAAGLLPGPAWH